jgi:Protein of unknown function (DUF998)
MRNPATASTNNTSSVTGILMACGVAAGPIYVVVGLVEAFPRQGLHLSRHSLSLLANGELGWIHSTMLVTTGLLTIAGAVSLGQALTHGRGRRWGPVLVGVYGAGLVVAGLLTADRPRASAPGRPPARS